ncbi:hypothetical protein C2S51_028440 [Perilla frutescens var. frutescens]|nr:hypothetical protein C2S51_028440 [Perilla frutescens var. frutescens]
MELENMLKQEAKSRNRAEKKLKFLMKKLEFMNISDESEYSGLIDKTDISSISSTASSITKQQQQQINEDHQQTRILISEVFHIQESKGKATSQKDLGDLEQIDSQNSSFSLSDDSSTAEGTLISSAFEVPLPQFKGLECEMRRYGDVTSAGIISEIVEQNVARKATFEDSLSSASDQHSEKSSSKMDQNSDICYDSVRSSADEGINVEKGHDSDSQVDNSMALVVVDTPPHTSHRIDPEALDATVKEVLSTLRRAKEELRSSMDRRRVSMIKVGEKNSTIKTSAIFI